MKKSFLLKCWILSFGVALLCSLITPAKAAVTLVPSSINLGEVHLTPGDSFTLSFSVAIECSSHNATHTCSITRDAPWITVPDHATCESTISGTATVNSALESGNYTGTIIVNCMEDGTANATVNLLVFREIGRKLILSPNKFNISFTKANLLPKTLFVKVANANPEDDRNFTWNAVPQVDWLSIEPSSGRGGRTVQLIVNPQKLSAGTHNGTVIFYSNLDNASATQGLPLEVTVEIYPPEELSVFPQNIFWTLEYGPGATLSVNATQDLHVYAGPSGYSISWDVPWLKVENESLNATTGPYSGIAEGILHLSVLPEYVPALGYGHHQGHIRVIDRESGFLRQVPVVLEIRPPGSQISWPLKPLSFSQLTPDYLFAQASVGKPLSFIGALSYQDQDLSQVQTFLLLEDSSNPQILWAYQPWCSDFSCVCQCLSADKQEECLEGLAWLFSQYQPPFSGFYPIEDRSNSVIFSWASCLAYSNGPIPEIVFGPQLIHKPGKFIFYTKVGPYYTASQTIQRMELKVFSPSGKWRITDIFQGVQYTHPVLLTLKYKDGIYQGSWYGEPLTFYPGDGKTYLFGFLMLKNGFVLEYQVTEISGNTLQGRWRYYSEDGVSLWSNFWGEKIEN